MLKVSSMFDQQKHLAIAKVNVTERGCAKFIEVDKEIFPVSGQAEHIGYLHECDKVICALIHEEYYLIARLLNRGQSPAYLWQQTSDERIMLQFGLATICIGKAGKVIIANDKASMCLDDEGHCQSHSKTFSINSFHHVLIETITGNIYCQYPEVMQ